MVDGLLRKKKKIIRRLSSSLGQMNVKEKKPIYENESNRQKGSEQQYLWSLYDILYDLQCTISLIL